MDTAIAEMPAKTEEKNLPLYLFVCTGNTCRSPMAAALFNFKYGDVAFARSCGVRASGKTPIADAAAAALKDRGVPEDLYKNHISTPADGTLLCAADRIICMTSDHLKLLMLDFPEMAGKIFAMPSDIFDPFGCTVDVYKRCLADIEAGLDQAFGGTEITGKSGTPDVT